MKLRVYGFSLDRTKAPPALDPLAFFQELNRFPGRSVGKRYRIGAKLLEFDIGGLKEHWHAGMVLKIRDSKAFTVFDEEAKVLRAEQLEGDRRLAELSFFIAHPQTGAGLIGHHYQAASVINFSFLCNRVFDDVRKGSLTLALEDETLTQKQKRKIRDEHRGMLSMNQLCRTDSLRNLVKSLAKVNQVKLGLSTVEKRNRLFSGLVEKAATETVIFTFPPGVAVEEIADAVGDQVVKRPDDEIEVTGVDRLKRPRHFKKNGNPFVFDEFDYDSVMTGLNLDLGDWEASIAKSVMPMLLVRAAQQPGVRHLIEHPPQ